MGCCCCCRCCCWGQARLSGHARGSLSGPRAPAAAASGLQRDRLPAAACRADPRLRLRLAPPRLPPGHPQPTPTPPHAHLRRWGIADLVTRFRLALGLPALSRANSGWALYRHPTTFMWSPALLPRPGDWPEHARVAGCPVDTSVTVPDGYSPPAELAAFLAAGGWGGGARSSSLARRVRLPAAPCSSRLPGACVRCA